MSYNGTINFGLVGDFDLLSDLDDLADDLQASLAELAEAAGVALETPTPSRRSRRRKSARSNGHKPGRRIGTTSTVTASGDSDT